MSSSFSLPHSSALTYMQWAGLIWVSYMVYWIIIYVYRITLHPLAKFPGPKLAAATFWYEFYYDVWPNDGRYLWRIKELHEQYGPIIRTNPYFLHIDDPDYYDEIYAAGSRKRDRDTWNIAGMGTNSPMAGSMFMAPTHEQHRQRRGAVGQYFSMKSIRVLEPLVKEKVDTVLRRLNEELRKGSVVNMSEVNAGLTLDVISSYCFGEGMRALESPDYGKSWRDQMMSGASSNPLFRQFPTLGVMLMTMPPWLTVKLNPLMAQTVTWTNNTIDTISRILSGKEEKLLEYNHPTIFHEIKDSDLPPMEKTPQRLMGEAFVFLGAGTETTSRILSVLDFYVLSDQLVYDKLFGELKVAMPRPDSPLALDQLMALPYLTACVNEALRVGHGVPGRTPRIARDEDLQYKGWTIPHGTPVSSMSYWIHMNPKVYPEPFKFKPERWLDNPGLHKHFVPFGRGSRACVGQNLARAELLLMTAHLFRRYGVELYDTNEARDVLIKHDCFIGMADRSSVGVRVKVVREVTD